MQKKITPITIGIIGGGQLGRMSAWAAQALGHKVVIFCDEKNSSASFATNETIVAPYSDKAALENFASKIDIATFEFENIPLETIEHLSAFKPVYPKANVLKITQNRILEKSFLNGCSVATASFAAVNNFDDLVKNIQKFGKSILKTATMGYDGKGQFVLENEGLAQKVWQENFANLKTLPPLILEKFCPFSSEISVIVARSLNGEIACFEPLTNIHKNGILDKSFYPAKVSQKCKNDAKEIAIKIAQSLDLQGVLAVEFFVMSGEELLVNELAPRPHNSGHFSMNAANTSQFEQLIRAITGLPLGDVAFHSNGYMQNLIGDDVENLQEFIANKNAKIHLYGKAQIKAGRKMGHVNLIEG